MRIPALARLVATLSFAVAGTMLTGCTAGFIVDENFVTVSSGAGATFTFVGVDDSGKPNGNDYTYYFMSGSARPYAVSFDPYSPESDSLQAQSHWIDGVPNSST